MKSKIKKMACSFMILVLPILSFAQKDVTQFLGIPVDGNKTEMINKLKSKGFTIKKESQDVLEGEFNGSNVNIFIGTNNNKVWRIAVLDANSTDEINIKIRFNNLINQFAKNIKYTKEADSTLEKYTIPENEKISYEINVHKKRYEALFYQKSLKYDSLINETADLMFKDSLSDIEKEKYPKLFSEAVKASSDRLYKQVWFMIKEEFGRYSIVIFYENTYNKDDGEGL